jgi:hypothetical protein
VLRSVVFVRAASSQKKNDFQSIQEFPHIQKNNLTERKSSVFH